MIKKDAMFEYTLVKKEAFEKIKMAIVVTPPLSSPDFKK